MLSLDTKWRPINNWVRVRRCTGTEVRKDKDGHLSYWADGIILPDRTGDVSHQCVIIDIGPKCELVRQEHLQEAADSGEYLRCWMTEDCGQYRIHDEDFVVREDRLIPCLIIG